jgi:hypothetical protein
MPALRHPVPALDQQAAFETGSGADEGDEVGCVDGSPPLLCGLHTSLTTIAKAAAGLPAPLVTSQSITREEIRPPEPIHRI